MAGGAVPVVVPDTFVLAENGDVVKARARYERTMQWRKDLEVDDILRVCFHRTNRFPSGRVGKRKSAF